jgi:hypothetical protein
VWLQRLDPIKTWAKFDFKLSDLCMKIFESATAYTLWNGEPVHFWKDRWLDGARLEDFSPNLLRLIPVRFVNTCLVKEGFSRQWLRDYGPNLGQEALVEFYLLWQRVVNILLDPSRKMFWCGG